MDAVKIIRDANWRLEVGDITREQYEELIAPLRDVEAVVRCWDCKHWKHFRGGLGNCKHPKFVEPLTENYHFCGYGERKDGDHAEGIIQKERS